MERQYSTVDIKGTVFCVDAYRDSLWQKDNPKNRIPFGAFDQNGDGYRFLYDLERRTIPASKEAVLENPERYCWVIIIALMELDPEGIALRYDIPLDILCSDTGKITSRHIIATIKPIKLPR
jgi:hypothetical protein